MRYDVWFEIQRGETHATANAAALRQALYLAFNHCLFAMAYRPAVLLRDGRRLIG